MAELVYTSAEGSADRSVIQMIDADEVVTSVTRALTVSGTAMALETCNSSNSNAAIICFISYSLVPGTQGVQPVRM